MANPTVAAAKAAILAVQPAATFTEVEAYSSTVAAGLVISILPAVGTLVVPDQVISLVVSKGPFPASRWASVGIVAPENLQAAVEAPVTAVRLATMVFLDIPGDPTYVTDAPMNLNWADKEWIGVGQFGTMDGPTESLDLVTHPVKLTLSGVDASLLADALSTQYQGGDATIYLALFDPHTLAFIEAPVVLWAGFMDVMTIESDKNTGTIQLACEHELRRLPTPIRWTDEDQQSRHSGDLFFQWIGEIQGYVSGAGGGYMNYSGPGRSRERNQPRPF